MDLLNGNFGFPHPLSLKIRPANLIQGGMDVYSIQCTVIAGRIRLHIGRQRSRRPLIKGRIMKILYKIQTFFYIAVCRLNEPGIVIHCIFSISKLQNKQIFRSVLQKILYLKISSDNSLFTGIVRYIGICDQPFGIQASDFIGDPVHQIAICLNLHRKNTFRIHRRNGIPHIRAFHLRYISKQLVDLLILIIKIYDRKRCFLHLGS